MRKTQSLPIWNGKQTLTRFDFSHHSNKNTEKPSLQSSGPHFNYSAKKYYIYQFVDAFN